VPRLQKNIEKEAQEKEEREQKQIQRAVEREW